MNYTDNYDNVETGKNTYEEYICGDALRCLQIKCGWIDNSLSLKEVEEKIIATYGGTSEIAIIDCFRNNN